MDCWLFKKVQCSLSPMRHEAWGETHSELREFAIEFRRRRLEFGFSQSDVGLSVGRRFGTDFSQTTISRFEAFNLSSKNMLKLRPILESWIVQAEISFRHGFSSKNFLQSDFMVAAERAKAVGHGDVNQLEREAKEQTFCLPSPRSLYSVSPLMVPPSLQASSPSSDENFDHLYDWFESAPNLQPQQELPLISLPAPETPPPSAPIDEEDPDQLIDVVGGYVESPEAIKVSSTEDLRNPPPLIRQFNYSNSPYAPSMPIYVPNDPIYMGRRRRKRTVLHDEQKEALLLAFHDNPSPSSTAICEMAQTLGLDILVVRVWFANRRQYVRRIKKIAFRKAADFRKLVEETLPDEKLEYPSFNPYTLTYNEPASSPSTSTVVKNESLVVDGVFEYFAL